MTNNTTKIIDLFVQEKLHTSTTDRKICNLKINTLPIEEKLLGHVEKSNQLRLQFFYMSD